MVIDKIVVGYLETNCYILSLDKSAIVIDPGDEADKIINYLKNNNYNLEAILITHGHNDHIGGLNDLLKYKNVQVFSNLDEKEYIINKFKFRVIKTPGHTSDSITFYFYEDNIMFVGDFIFKDSIGRTDLDTGDFNQMKKSINNIKKYPDDTVLYPGHGDYTILGYEKMNNPYFI